MKIVIEIDDEQVLFDIRNRGLEAKSETDKVIIDALYNGIPLPKHHADLIERRCGNKACNGCEHSDICDTYNAPTIIEADKEGI